MAVGKTTFARILQALLARWPDHPKVDLVTTDGFLHPNAVLDERGMMDRKGFPESYDTRRLLRFLRELKSGVAEVDAPVYGHVVYDILAGGRVTVRQPDIVIVEGLNVLQVSDGGKEFVSDYFDFSIYIDADEERHRAVVRRALLQAPRVGVPEPGELLPALRRISPTSRRSRRRVRSGRRSTASTCVRTSCRPASGRRLILHKSADHRVREVELRKL